MPNITGSFIADTYYGLASGTGAFVPSTTADTSAVAQGHSNHTGKSFSFDASRSSAIYGASDTVTPLSMSYIPVIKY